MDEETADGNTPRYRKPSPRSFGIHDGAKLLIPLMGITTSGKNPNVSAVISMCNRQCDAPATICSRDNAAPWKKKSRATATVPAVARKFPAAPVAGRNEASAIAPSSRIVKMSGLNFIVRSLSSATPSGWVQEDPGQAFRLLPNPDDGRRPEVVHDLPARAPASLRRFRCVQWSA